MVLASISVLSREAFGRPSRGGSKSDRDAFHDQDAEDGVHEGRLADAGSAGDHHDLRRYRVLSFVVGMIPRYSGLAGSGMREGHPGRGADDCVFVARG